MDGRFRVVDREQLYLMPPDVREWLPAGHPALFVVDVVEALDLSAFVARSATTREHGRPAYHPSVMVGVLLYASMTRVMSSRRIERALVVDVGFRVVAANERPDHVTICRFLRRHADLLEVVFAEVVGLAAEAGLVDPTVIALDGTKMAGNASMSRTKRLGVLRERFADWAEQVAVNDDAEDAAEADDSSSGPRPEMFEQGARRAWIEKRLRERAAEPDDRSMNVTDPDSGLLRRSGNGGWTQGYNAQAAAVAGGIVVAADVTANPSDATMLVPMAERIADAVRDATGEAAGVIVADAGYWTSAGIATIEADDELPDVLVATGRQLPDTAPEPLPATNTTETDAGTDTVWDAAAERARRISIIARHVNGELSLAETAIEVRLSKPHVCNIKRSWLAGAGHDAVPPPRPPQPPSRRVRPPTPAARSRHTMGHRLARPAGRSIYRQRAGIIEPVFGDIKANRGITRFLRRGLDLVRAEWHWILTGHNLTMLHNRAPTATG